MALKDNRFSSRRGNYFSEHMMLSGEDEEMVHCPYNFAHVVLKSRLPVHLIKCRQQHVIEKFTTCPFNSTHDVPAVELQYHVQTCPDRKNLDNYVYVIGEPKPQEVIPHLEVPVSTENWDEDETAGVSYLDVKDKRLENERVFRRPVGMSKGQRKAFFQSEAKKFEKVASQEGKSSIFQNDKASTSMAESAGGGESSNVSKAKWSGKRTSDKAP